MIKTYIYYVINAVYQMAHSYLLLMAVAAILTDYKMPLYYVTIYLFVVFVYIGAKYLNFSYKPITLDVFRVAGVTIGFIAAMRLLNIVEA